MSYALVKVGKVVIDKLAVNERKKLQCAFQTALAHCQALYVAIVKKEMFIDKFNKTRCAVCLINGEKKEEYH